MCFEKTECFMEYKNVIVGFNNVRSNLRYNNGAVSLTRISHFLRAFKVNDISLFDVGGLYPIIKPIIKNNLSLAEIKSLQISEANTKSNFFVPQNLACDTKINDEDYHLNIRDAIRCGENVSIIIELNIESILSIIEMPVHYYLLNKLFPINNKEHSKLNIFFKDEYFQQLIIRGIEDIVQLILSINQNAKIYIVDIEKHISYGNFVFKDDKLASLINQINRKIKTMVLKYNQVFIESKTSKFSELNSLSINTRGIRNTHQIEERILIDWLKAIRNTESSNLRINHICSEAERSFNAYNNLGLDGLLNDLNLDKDEEFGRFSSLINHMILKSGEYDLTAYQIKEIFYSFMTSRLKSVNRNLEAFNNSKILIYEKK